jgi:fatty-acyl-CoA synthase
MKKSRQGVPYIVSNHVDIVDPETMTPVPRDGQTVGEIVMRGNTVMLGYYNDPEATAKAFAGGWFHTGDLGVMHTDNYLEIMDRAKDIVISGGENISTLQVERVLLQHPGVAEAAVIAAPDEKWGEVPKAFVVPKEGASLTVSELVAFSREHLPGFKVPKLIDIISSVPRTSLGKPNKAALRKNTWQGISKGVN